MKSTVVYKKINYETGTTIEIVDPELYANAYIKIKNKIYARMKTGDIIRFDPVNNTNNVYLSENNLYFFEDYHIGDLLNCLRTNKRCS